MVGLSAIAVLPASLGHVLVKNPIAKWGSRSGWVQVAIHNGELDRRCARDGTSSGKSCDLPAASPTAYRSECSEFLFPPAMSYESRKATGWNKRSRCNEYLSVSFVSASWRDTALTGSLGPGALGDSNSREQSVGDGLSKDFLLHNRPNGDITRPINAVAGNADFANRASGGQLQASY